MEGTATPDAAFADTERERLAQLERTIARGLDTYVEVGRALEEIRTRRLFLAVAPTFKQYLADRWNLSESRGFALCYSAQVADVLEAAGERPAGAESALREFSPVLHSRGPEATVAAFQRVAEDGVLPPAPKMRQKLVDAGLVDAAPRGPADQFCKRLTVSQRALAKLRPHPKLVGVYGEYSARLTHAALNPDSQGGKMQHHIEALQPLTGREVLDLTPG